MKQHNKMKKRSKEEILEEIESVKSIGLNMALSGFNPYSYTGKRLDKLHKELEASQSETKEKTKGEKLK